MDESLDILSLEAKLNFIPKEEPILPGVCLWNPQKKNLLPLPQLFWVRDIFKGADTHQFLSYQFIMGDLVQHVEKRSILGFPEKET